MTKLQTACSVSIKIPCPGDATKPSQSYPVQGYLNSSQLKCLQYNELGLFVDGSTVKYQEIERNSFSARNKTDYSSCENLPTSPVTTHCASASRER